MKHQKNLFPVRNSIESVAQKAGVPVDEVIREIQIAIDMAWVSSDPVTTALQREYFPNGKPTPEEFIVVMARREMDTRAIVPFPSATTNATH